MRHIRFLTQPPVDCVENRRPAHGIVAQKVERLPVKQDVGGSSPSGPVSFYSKEVYIVLISCFVLLFLVPDAIVSGPFEFVYFETIERIDAVSARAIVGHTANGKTPRVVGTRSWLLDAIRAKYNSSATGK